jgi:prepilin-type N-terminal cleavage/methylation domain-containing protein
MHCSSRRQGFTLIELLIVVAIIGILSAIAIPNFLQAQLRAKIARVKGDLRTIKIALLQYDLDHEDLPVTPVKNPFNGWDYATRWTLVPLTTPISYLSATVFVDPFNDFHPYGSQYPNYYQYWRRGAGIRTCFLVGASGNRHPTIMADKWMLCCVGPSTSWPSELWGGTPHQTPVYDPTNGLVSPGILWITDVAQMTQ